MTTITLVQKEDTPNVNNAILTTIKILLMMVALAGAVSLLNWALNSKQASYIVATSSNITAEMRERQLGCLAKNIYHEAGGEPFEGKVAVAQVTINRTESGQFPSDICQVVYQKNVVYEKVLCQFSWYCENASSVKPRNTKAYQESEIVARQVLLENFRLPSLKQALYFHGAQINPKWNKERVGQIGNHIFYK